MEIEQELAERAGVAIQVEVALEIAAGGEMATRAADHDGLHRVVGLELALELGEALYRAPVERVALLGPVERDRAYAARDARQHERVIGGGDWHDGISVYCPTIRL